VRGCWLTLTGRVVENGPSAVAGDGVAHCPQGEEVDAPRDLMDLESERLPGSAHVFPLRPHVAAQQAGFLAWVLAHPEVPVREARAVPRGPLRCQVRAGHLG
jgi:hypothetical protein